MRKLLHADFARLGKDKGVCLIFLGTLLVSVYMPTTWNLYYGDVKTCVDSVLFQLIPYLPFLCTLVSSLFLGAEFEGNALRNKLIVGHTRAEVYFSAYLTVMAACLLILAAMLGGAGVSGWLRYRDFQMAGGQLAYLILCCILCTMVFSAICVAFLMNVPRKPAIFVTLLFLAMLYSTSFFGARLNEAEMVYDGIAISMDGGVEFGDLIPNPAYVSGTTRKVFELLYDLLPTGQTIQLNNGEFDRCLRWAPLSAVVLAVSTVAGFLPFRKRDLR